MHPDLAPAKRLLKPLAPLCLLLLLACAPAGCGSKAAPGGAGAGAGADTKAFLSAPPEIKAAWDGALAALQTNNQAEAYLTLSQLRREVGLTPDQKAAIDAQRAAINLQLAAAAQKGDTHAAEALSEIRKAARTRGR